MRRAFELFLGSVCCATTTNIASRVKHMAKLARGPSSSGHLGSVLDLPLAMPCKLLMASCGRSIGSIIDQLWHWSSSEIWKGVHIARES